MEFLNQEILADIGLFSLAAIVLLVLALFMGLILAYIIFKKKGFSETLHGISSMFLRILLLILDSLYIPAKRIVSFFGGDDLMIDHAASETRNLLLKKEFSKVPYSGRIVIAPQCLRHMDCKTSFSSEAGAQCLGCKKCKIFEIAKKANELGYKGTYIAPGGGFVKRIIKRFKPSGVIGIGCPYEINMGLLEVSNKGIPCQGVLLLNSGCVGTDIDLEEVFNVMELIKNGKDESR